MISDDCIEFLIKATNVTQEPTFCYPNKYYYFPANAGISLVLRICMVVYLCYRTMAVKLAHVDKDELFSNYNALYVFRLLR